MQQLFKRFANGDATTIDMVVLKEVEVPQKFSLRMTNIADSPGLSFGGSESELVWNHLPAVWSQFSDICMELSSCDTGHQYLEHCNDNIVFEITKGEYGDDYFSMDR